MQLDFKFQKLNIYGKSQYIASHALNFRQISIGSRNTNPSNSRMCIQVSNALSRQ